MLLFCLLRDMSTWETSFSGTIRVFFPKKPSAGSGPFGPLITVTPWPAGAGLLSIGDRTIRLTRPCSAVPLFSSKLSKRLAVLSSPPNSRGLTASGGAPIPAGAFAARARSSHAAHRCGALLSNLRPHPALGELRTCSEQRLLVLPAVV